jgi:hypothetical protein
MTKAERQKPNSYPDCILLDDGTVLPWDQATKEMQTVWLQANRPSSYQNGDPDTGQNKRQRRKKRRARHHS